MNNQIVKVGGQDLTVNDAAYAHCLSATGSLLGPRRYIAQKHGLCTSKHEKSGQLDWTEIKDMNTKEVVAAIVATGVSKDTVKADIAAYNAGKEAFYGMSTKVTALIGADASLRKDVRVIKGSKGNFIGFNVKARFAKQSPASASSAARIAELEAKLAAAQLLLGQGAAA